MRILIAEDNPVSRLLLKATLKKQGHDVVVTENGSQAWTAYQRQHVPVLISDWLMPELDGLALCRLVNKARRDNYTVFLLLTSQAGKTNYLEAMEAGADDFMTKPFDADQLAARLKVAERMLDLRQHVRHLEGLLPICCYCKGIRDEQNTWQQMEHYVSQRSAARFSHGICPPCMEKLAQEI